MTIRREIRFLLNDKEGNLNNVETLDNLLDYHRLEQQLAETKPASFKNWYHRDGGGQLINTLTCPIGATGSRDKRPAVIAAFVIAEAITALTSETTVKIPEKGTVSH